MELKTTTDCKLIIEGAPKSGKEIFVRNYNEVISIERTSEIYTYNMEKDGLYQYYVLDLPEIGGPSDLIDYISDNKIDPEGEIFAICKLRNCLIQKEKDSLNDFLKDCKNGGVFCNKNSDKNLNDFLLISEFLLENLICRGNYQEAIRILNSISNCGICDNTSEKTCKHCG